MTKTKSTKRALLLSALSLLMCVSMLIGSTFAWFTDSVTSAGNKIQAGTLKIDLELLDKTSGAWNSIKEDKTALFDYDLWEPGYTEVKILKIENEGSLALKWMAKFVSEENLGILADVIDVYVCPSATALTYPADRDLTGYEYVGTVRDFVNTIEDTTYGSLKAEEEAYLGIALKMQESAGNDYQGKTLGAFDIQIVATQLTYESDSFNNQYDKEATYPGEAGTAEELKNAISNGESVKLSADIVMDQPLTFDAADDVKIDLAGNKLEVGYVTIGGGSDVVISDSTGTGADLVIDATNFIIAEGSTVTLDGVDVVTEDTGIAVDTGSTLNMYNGTVTVRGYNGGIFLSNLDGVEATFNMYGGEIIVEGGFGITVDARYDSAMNINLYGGKITLGESSFGVCVNNGAANLLIDEGFVFEVNGQYSKEYYAMNGNVNVTDKR